MRVNIQANVLYLLVHVHKGLIRVFNGYKVQKLRVQSERVLSAID